MSFPRLNIITRKPIKLIRNYKYNQYSYSIKPNGLWISLYDHWYNFWFIQEQMEPISGTIVYKIELNPNSYTTRKRYRSGNYPKKIFVVETIDDIKYINDEFKPILNSSLEKLNKNNNFINWKKFTERYAGIEIRNFNNKFRRKNTWYDTFDVDSLCVWDLNLVKTIRKMKKHPVLG